MPFPLTLDCLSEAVQLTKNDDEDKYKYRDYGMGFDSRSEISLPEGSIGKNVIIFGVDMSSSVHIDNKKKDIQFLIKVRRKDKVILRYQKKLNIQLIFQYQIETLSLHFNGSNSFLLVNATKIYIISRQMILK